MLNDWLTRRAFRASEHP